MPTAVRLTCEPGTMLGVGVVYLLIADCGRPCDINISPASSEITSTVASDAAPVANRQERRGERGGMGNGEMVRRSPSTCCRVYLT
jgi:hypothetical protein